MKIFYNHRMNEKGVALITMILLSVLVVGLVLMALNNGMVGMNLSNAHLTGKRNVECGEGSQEIGTEMITYLEENSTNPHPKIKIDPELKPGNATLQQELRGELDASEESNVIATDISIEDPDKPDCQTDVDIDYLHNRKNQRNLPGGDAEDAMVLAYHKPVFGRGCDDGTYYNIATETTNTATATLQQSIIRSVYYKC